MSVQGLLRGSPFAQGFSLCGCLPSPFFPNKTTAGLNLSSKICRPEVAGLLAKKHARSWETSQQDPRGQGRMMPDLAPPDLAQGFRLGFAFGPRVSPGFRLPFPFFSNMTAGFCIFASKGERSETFLRCLHIFYRYIFSFSNKERKMKKQYIHQKRVSLLSPHRGGAGAAPQCIE